MRIFFTRRFYASPDDGRTTRTYHPGRTFNVPADIPPDIAEAALNLGVAKRGAHTDPTPEPPAPVKPTPKNKAHRAAPQNKSAGRNLA